MLPQDLKDSAIVSLYKNKGDKKESLNYRGITLFLFLSSFWPVSCCLAAENTPERQCDFRANRRTTDMNFVLRQILDKYNIFDDTGSRNGRC